MIHPQKPGAAFWATVVVVVLLLYPLSFGPACWISSWTDCGGEWVLPFAYRPVLTAGDRSEAIWRVAKWYAELGADEGWFWVDRWLDDSGVRQPMWIGPPRYGPP